MNWHGHWIALCLVLFVLIPTGFQQSLTSKKFLDCPRRCSCTRAIVNCANKGVTSFPRDLPLWTQVLILSDNPLETLESEFMPLLPPPSNLTQIDLSRTQLSQFDPDYFSTLFNDVNYIDDHLKVLNLAENVLDTVPLIRRLSSLTVLDLSSNKLDDEAVVQVPISHYPSLQSLDLSSNQIRRIPRHFLVPSQEDNTQLTTLILNKNEIEVIEKGAFEALVHLQVLRLSKNSLKVISRNFFGDLPNLKELDLNFNQIEQIDSLAFNSLSSLQVLKLRRNRLAHLPDGTFWGLSKLQKLQLDHNNITDVRLGWTFGMASLAELSLRHNSVEEIQDGSWNSAFNLVELHLNFNRIQKINRDSLSKLTKLKVLKLPNNQISMIDEQAFRETTSLEVLDLSNNELSWTIENSNGFFSTLNLLKKLRLDNNHFKHIFKHTFSNLNTLQMINLTGNPISSIQSDSFTWFKNLKEFYLENSDLLCDCSMKWFYDWLDSSDVHRSFADRVRCKHPLDLNIQTQNSFLDANKKDFICQDFLRPYLIDDFHNIDKPITAIKNKNIVFYCKVASSSSDAVQFQWFKDKQKVNSDRAVSKTLASIASENVTHYTNMLTLQDVQDEDQGMYHCMASNNFGAVYSHKFQVNVYITPHFIKVPSNITIKVGNTARLECAAKGQPSPIISWQKDGGDNFPAAMERRMHVMPADDVFFIVEAKRSDMGVYACNATNDAGSVITTAYLNVYEPPFFMRKMIPTINSTVGSTIYVECIANGWPTPDITWYKDGFPLSVTERHVLTVESQLLVIAEARPSDAGQYSCKISNQYGSVQESSYVKIFHNLDKVDNFDFNLSFVTMAHSMKSFMMSRGIILFLVFLCVFCTSLVWICVICYIGRRGNKSLKSTENSHQSIESCYSDQDFGPTDSYHKSLHRNGTVKRNQSYYNATDLDGYISESSSAKVCLCT